MHVKFLHELPEDLYSTAGWDAWSKLQEGDLPSQLHLSDDGAVGAHECFGDASSPRLKVNEWAAVTATVDTTAGVMCTYVNGRQGATIKVGELGRDGQHSIKRRLALFFSKAPPKSSAFVYVRSVAVHALVLSPEQASRRLPLP